MTIVWPGSATMLGMIKAQSRAWQVRDRVMVIPYIFQWGLLILILEKLLVAATRQVGHFTIEFQIQQNDG